MTSIKKNYLMDLLYTLSGMVFPLLTYHYAAGILGKEGIGAVSFANGILAVFLMASQMGIPYYGIKACAVVREDRQALSRTVMEIFRISMMTCLAVCLVYVICVFTVPRLASDKVLFLVMGTMLVFNSIGAEWLYRALEQNRYIAVRSIMLRSVSLVLILVCVRTGSDYVLYGAITVFALSGAGIINFFNLHRHVDFVRVKHTDLTKHFRMIGIFMAMNAATTIYSNMDTVMLGFMRGNADTGEYDAAVKVKNILVTVVLSLGSVLMPRLSLYASKGEKSESDRITQKSMHFLLLLSLPLCLFFMLEAGHTVLILAGESFMPGVRAMQILMPVLVLIAMTNVMGIQIMVPQGMERQVLCSETGGVFVNLVLNLLLIPRFGVTGAALGTLGAEITVFLHQAFALRSRLGTLFGDIAFWKLGCSLVMAGTAVYLFAPGGCGIPSFILSTICFFVIYGGVLLLLKEKLLMELWRHIWPYKGRK